MKQLNRRHILLIIALVITVKWRDMHPLTGPQVRFGAGFRRQGIIDVVFAVDDILILLGKGRKAVQTEHLGEDDLVPLPQD